MKYYYITSKSEDNQYFVKEKRDRLECLECQKCYLLVFPIKSLDVYIDSRRIQSPLNSVGRDLLGLMHRDFRTVLGRCFCEPTWSFGKVYDWRERIIPDWVVYFNGPKIIVRGDQHAGVRICEGCGRKFYFAMGKEYLYPAPPSGVPVFHAEGSRLVITEEVKALIDFKKWPKLVCEELPVLEEPLDNLGIL